MDKKSWTVPDLLQLTNGYWSACALFAGVKLDLFTRLGERRHRADELAGALGCDARALAMLLNALSALNLLEKQDDCYAVTPFAAKFLSRTSPEYLGYIILHHYHLMDGWARLDEAVKSGGPVRASVSHGDDEVVHENFEMGMFNLAMLVAPKITPRIDLTGRRRLLDLGGGPGTYAIHFCRSNPELTAVVYDLPTTRPFAEQTIERFGLSSRISFQGGDFDSDDIRGRFDVVWFSQVLHSSGPDGCAALLKKAVAALEPGGMILVQEFILDDTLDSPPFPALFSLNMLIGTPGGQAYSQGQLFEMLSAAGAVNLRRLPLDLPNGAGVIAGNVPGSGEPA